MDAHANFAISKVAVAPTPAATGATLTLEAGTGSRMPAAPFNAAIYPEGVLPTPTIAEIVRVTARSGDVLTITRKQEGSSARSVLVGDLFVAGLTVKAVEDLEAAITGETARAVAEETQINEELAALNANDKTTATQLASLEARVAALSGSAPVVATNAATAASPTGATLHGEVNPQGLAGEYWFEYGPSTSLGSRTAKVALAAGISVLTAVEAALAGSGFTSGTYFRLVASTAAGQVSGALLQLGTMAPTSLPAPATNVSGSSITMNGQVAANGGGSTTVTFEWSATRATVEGGTGTTASGGTTTSDLLTPVSATITGTFTGTLYYRVKAVNSKGTTNSSIQEVTVSGAALLVGDTSTTYANADQTSKGRVEAFKFTAGQSGSLTELQFRTATASAALTGVVLAILADSGGKPDATKILASGEVTGATIKEANKWIAASGLTAATIVAGSEYWLCVLPKGGTLFFNSSVASGGTPAQESASSLGELSTIAGATSWEADAQGGPVGFQGLGTVTATTVPVPKVNATDKETVEWNSISTETEYEIAVSSLPAGSTGRKTGFVKKAKTANPQTFKPEAGVAYLNTGGSYTPAPSDTVYVEVRVAGGSWSTAVSVKLPAAPVTSSAVLSGIHLNWRNGQEPFNLAAKAGVSFVRPGSAGYTLPEALKYAALEGIKVSFILPPVSGTFNLKKVIEEWEPLTTAQKNALLCVELGNENWGSSTVYGGGVGSFIAGQALAEQFIKAAEVQESKSWPVPICLQARMVPEHGAVYMEEQAKANKTSLKTAFQSKSWLPTGNWITCHNYLGPMTSEQESSTSFTNVKDTGSPFTTANASKWGGQRWIKEQYFWYKELGIVVPAIVTEYGVEDNGSEGQNVESAAQVAATMKYAWEHCRKLEKGEYPTKRPTTAYAPKLMGFVWYDQNSWEGAGQGRFGIYFANNKPRTEAGIYETFKAGAEAL